MDVVTAQRLRIAWLEITGKCQLQCLHCYAESGPGGTHGSMSRENWISAIDEIVLIGADTVQFIGGEPTLHPDFDALVRYALWRDLSVEVYTNLVTVSEVRWELFTTPGVRLATSYYSDSAEEHARVVGASAAAYRLTTKNIGEAVRRGISIRVGLVDVADDQRMAQARALLDGMGVTEIGFDRLRGVGRGGASEDMSQLCGQCSSDSIAIAPDGTVWPCVFTRWMPVGNIKRDPLHTILRGDAMNAAVQDLDAEFAQRQQCAESACSPGTCSPTYCSPMTMPK